MILLMVSFFFFFILNTSPNNTLADIISTVEFDQTGDYLATGDKGGRVVLFERNESVKYFAFIKIDCIIHIIIQKKNCEYRFYTEFQSHEAEFDYLKSLEIEEKINKIKWCKRQNSAHFLLSTNGKKKKQNYIFFIRYLYHLQIKPSSCGKYLTSH